MCVCLQPDALLVPSAGRVFAQVVSSPDLHAFSKPHSTVPSRYKHLKLPPSIDICPGTISLHDIQMSQLSQHSFTSVSNPITVFEFDWSGRKIPLTTHEINNIPFTPLLSTSNEHQTDSESEQSVVAKDSKACHAVLMWWDLTMDQSGDVMLTCAPHWLQPNSTGANTVPWRDHWMQAIYHLPPPLLLPSNHKQLTLTAARDEYSLWFAISSKPE